MSQIKKFSPIMWVIAVLAVLLLGAIVFSVFQVTSLKHQVNVAQAENEQLQLTNEQLSLSNEFEAINSEFRQYENQAVQMANDTILAKYTAAKNKVEQLIKELNSEKTKNAKRIKDLESQIATLRGLLRNYIAQVDSLTKENAGLRAENQEIKSRNKALNSQVAEISGKNKTLTERMTLAEKLNVTGLTLTPLKKNGKQEKNVTKAKQLKVTFTIPQNNSTPVGAKTIYLRIVNPEGQLLGNAGSFSFEGGNVPCSAKKTIEYTGDEMSGVTIYWDVNTTLTPGDYLVELFADNFRIASRHFTLKK
ncbi:MAG TPA: hypothetical protein DCE24_00295 [Porphyromonadaceae bacterium]|nr:hypothetical protein [Paramuribaculum sp.]HAB40267.1 hypothetical protein [Porphyromonadaceae bacterium]